jgi:phosphatidylinositol glycan class B
MLGLGLLVRIAVACIADHVHHPDEIFQSFEQAHRVVFGYGIIPWEFRFGTRSWLTPGLVAGVLQVCRIFGLTDPGSYILAVKLFLCGLSASLILSSYAIGRRLGSERAGLLAAFFAAFWYELIYFAPRPLTTPLATYAFMGSLALALRPSDRATPWAVGALAALAVAVRLQMLPAAAVLGAFALWRWDRPTCLRAAAGACTVAIAVAALDQVTWGAPLRSYANNYVFNVVHGISATFGTKPVTWYLETLAITSGGLFVATLAWALLRPRAVALPLLCLVALLLAHSLIGHKEYRFVFAAIPLSGVILAVLVDAAIATRVPLARQRLVGCAVAAVLAGSSLAGLLDALPGQARVFYRRPLKRDRALAVYRSLARNPEVGAVLDLTNDWWASGGYTHLHRDVPLYFESDVSSGALPQSEWHRYATHVIARHGEKRPAEFELESTYRKLEIWRNRDRKVDLPTLPDYSRHRLREGIDGVFAPQVARDPD